MKDSSIDGNMLFTSTKDYLITTSSQEAVKIWDFHQKVLHATFEFESKGKLL